MANISSGDTPNRGPTKSMSSAAGVKGRVEVVPTPPDYTIVIDYAHTPDALENVLKTLREVSEGRLVALFGCGGDRDKTKRPRMGAIAADNADLCVVTSDNPRTEEPEAIIADILAGMAAADLILCRSGASTLAELTYLGKPVILVPSPNVTNNHQEKNARVIEKAGGAKVLLEGEFDAALLLETVKTLLADPEGLRGMAAAMKSLAVPDAAEKITEIVLSLCR